jgi:ubiquinone/menaquinone biosynthesis C-methylase UbiE
MGPGDFTSLAVDYARYRSGYSETLADALRRFLGRSSELLDAVDVGAGTGIWTRMMADRQCRVVAVEPNDAMREQGRAVAHPGIRWHEGKGEETGLASGCAEWVTMASSFHWTDPARSLPEFARLLRRGGHFTALWNPRDLENNAFHQEIESLISSIVPDLKRVSSGSKRFLQDLESKLVSTGHFEDVLYMEARHSVSMTPERYVGVWRSVNDIQAQAGPERFARILEAIEKKVSGLQEIVVPYLTRAWTVRKRTSA